jgi:hypothetical protein
MAIKWRGSKKLRRQADLDWDFQGSKTIVTISYVGPYAQCLAARPPHGSELGDMAGYRVTNSRVRRQAGGIGRLSVTAEAEGTSVGVTDNNDATSTQLEIEWAQVEKPLRQHPMYKADGAHELDATELADLERWEHETDTAIKGAFQFKDKPEAETATALTPDAAHLAAKLLKGIDSYLLYLPILRKTTNHPRQPTTGNCGTTGIPTDFPSRPMRSVSEGVWVAYVWLKTADRATNSGEHNTWQRIQEWTGFDEVDTDLYPAG